MDSSRFWRCPAPAHTAVPVALFQQVSSLLAAKLLVPLQLVHTVAAVFALRVLPHTRARTHIYACTRKHTHKHARTHNTSTG